MPRQRLFSLSFAAITATSFCFILRALVVDQWGSAFALSETQKGELLGAGLWPFAITIVLFSLVIDRVGFKATFWFAALCHAGGLLVLLTATGYGRLYLGTFVMALGNGAVEAAANPLIATLFHEDKPRWLNRLHAAWPGGMIAGGVLAMALGDATAWQVKVALMALPVLAYAAMLPSARFPLSERVASGVSYREMLAEAGWGSALVIATLIMLEIGRLLALSPLAVLAAVAALTGAFAAFARSAGRPLYIVLVLLMIPLAITELSTDSWISSLMEPQMHALGLQAGWVLVYASLVVFGIRLVAGSVIARLTPLGTLAAASAVTAVGLLLLAGANGPALLLAATVYGIGKSFFWGTSLAISSEQFPRGGAVTMNIVAGAGMLAAGIIGSALLGTVQDIGTARAIEAHDLAQGTALSQRYLKTRAGALTGSYRALDPTAAAAAPPPDAELLASIGGAAKKDALRTVAVLPAFMLASYLGLILLFRRRGGYRPVVLPANAPEAG